MLNVEDGHRDFHVGFCAKRTFQRVYRLFLMFVLPFSSYILVFHPVLLRRRRSIAAMLVVHTFHSALRWIRPYNDDFLFPYTASLSFTMLCATLHSSFLIALLSS